MIGSLFSWLQGFFMAGIIVRTVYRLRREVDDKVTRLPLKFFDSHARGDILSRLTNDIDNIQQTMQQVLTQIITSVLTLVGVLAMMFWLSWELALISLVVVPVSSVLAMVIAKRSQKQFALQWERTGDLNGHVEEMFTGHNIVKIFGRQKEAVELFDRAQRGALSGELQGPVHLGHHHAGHDLRLQPELRGGVRDGWAAGGERRHEPWRRAGVHPVRSAVRSADRPDGQRRQRASVGGGLG